MEDLSAENALHGALHSLLNREVITLHKVQVSRTEVAWIREILARSLEQIHAAHHAEHAFNDTKAENEEAASQYLEDSVLASGNSVPAKIASTDVHVQEAIEGEPNTRNT